MWFLGRRMMNSVDVIKMVVERNLRWSMSYLIVVKLWKKGLVLVLMRFKFFIVKLVCFLNVWIVDFLVMVFVKWFIIGVLVVLLICIICLVDVK